jgi:hypothetical protein
MGASSQSTESVADFNAEIIADPSTAPRYQSSDEAHANPAQELVGNTGRSVLIRTVPADGSSVVGTLIFLGRDVAEEAVEAVVVVPGDPVEDDLLNLGKALQRAAAEGLCFRDRFVLE